MSQKEITGHLSDDLPIDYFADMNVSAEDVSEDRLVRLTNLVEQAAENRRLATEHEVKAAEFAEQVKKIERELIPNLMQEIGISDFKMTDGTTIKVTEKVNASISEVNRPAAFDWLQQNNYDGIIKTKVTSEFGKGEMGDALKAAEAMREAGYMASVDRTVHPATLKSFVNERLSAGDSLPSCFSVFEFKEAVIKSPKKSKK